MIYFFQKYYFFILSALSFFALSFAYYAEYVWELDPCVLCVYERVPYMILLGTSIAALFFKMLSLFIKFFQMILLVGALGLSLYHVGVEKKVFHPPLVCATPKALKGLSVEDLEARVMKRKVMRCDQVHWRFISYSAAEWNVFIFFMLLLGMGILWKRKS